jgi:hypothetical protein
VSNAPATAALPNAPDPSPDQAAANAPVPTRTGRLLSVIRTLIAYGTGLVQALQERTSLPASVARSFGTLDIALILSRIARGLQLATALEARVVAHPLRETAPSTAVRAPSDRTPPLAEPAAPRRRRPVPPPLPDMPTAEEIAEAARHRPVGAVIAEICRDLGIVPSNPLWHEVMLVVDEFGGNGLKLFNDVVDRLCTWLGAVSALPEAGLPMPGSLPAAACATGPP